MQDEKERFAEFLAEKETHVQQLALRLEGTVRWTTHDRMLKRYVEAKHLSAFNERRVQSSGFEFERQKEAMERAFRAREEGLGEEVRAIEAEQRRTRAANAKLVAGVQSRRLRACMSSDAECVPREELMDAEARIQPLVEGREALERQNQQLSAALDQGAESERALSAKLARVREKSKSQSQFAVAAARALQRVYGCIERGERGVARLCGVLKPVFAGMGLAEVRVAPAADRLALFVSGGLAVAPDGAGDRVRRMVRRCERALLALPIVAGGERA